MNNKEQVFISGLNRIISYWKFESKLLTFKLLSALAGLSDKNAGAVGMRVILLFLYFHTESTD